MSDLGVVMLSPGFHPALGGAEKQALELSKALRAKGVRVRVLTRRLPGLAAEETVEGIPVSRVAAWGGGLLNAVVFLCSSLRFLLARADEYDVIHVHLAGSPALAACVAGALLGKRVVVKVGGGRGIGEIALSGRTLAGRLKLGVLRRFRPRFVAVSRDLVDELGTQGLADRATVIPNGVDTRRHRPAAARGEARRDLGWPGGLCLLYVGRIAVEKRLPMFLEAFAAALRETGSEAFFAIVGSGPEEAAVRAARERLGLEGRVRLQPPTPAIERVYAAADVFVLPSISEGLSNALLEAMSSGLAVFASRVGGTGDTAADGVSGLLFEPMDEEGLRRQLRRLLTEPGLAARLGEAARKAVEEKYDIERTAEEYIRLYREETTDKGNKRIGQRQGEGTTEIGQRQEPGTTEIGQRQERQEGQRTDETEGKSA